MAADNRSVRALLQVPCRAKSPPAELPASRLRADMVSRLIIQTAIWVAVLAALLFIPAGRLDWPAAWVTLAEMGLGGLAVGLWLARHDPGLLAERLAPAIQRDQKSWDKLFVAALILFWCTWFVVMGLDAGRDRGAQIPLWAQVAGALAILLSLYVVHLTFRENSFAAPVVKIQKARGQKVVTTGPYAHVRHPMYAGALLMLLGIPLLLGSWYGLALVPVLVAGLAVRVVMEERMLRAELAGYTDYAARVRYRLVPLIW
jgi:protein-S-isoprenylcysteine O-methyltransferase Ste14